MKPGYHANTLVLLKDPKAQEKIVELKDSNKYSSWDDIKTKFNEEFDSQVSISAIRNAYNKSIATSITVSGPKHNPLNKLADSMGNRLNNIMSVTDILLEEFEKTIEWLRNAKELEPVQRMDLIGRVARTNESLSNSFVKQIALVASQLEQVKIEQTKIQWSEARVHEELNKLLPNMLKSLEEPDDEGNQKIMVLDRSLVGE